MTPTLIIISLVLLGILMMLMEFLLVPGIGIAGIVGLASFVGACVYAFNVTDTLTATIVTAVVAVIVIIMLVWMLRGKTWKKFELKQEIDEKTNREPEKLAIGDKGVAATRLAPIGMVRFQKTSCEAKSFDNTMLAAGTEVEIVEIEDNKVQVKPINK